MNNIKGELQKIIKNALDEDDALNDVTSDLTINEDHQISFEINSREEIILCGVEAVKICFDILKNNRKFKKANLELEILKKDGDYLAKNDIIAKGFGQAKLILAAERVILNTIQHLSGVATNTRKFIDALDDKKTQILDTRKTTLGLRKLEKYGVATAGGANHRFNLSDMILIKDNHIAACYSIQDAIIRAKKSNKIVEIECDNLSQVRQALSAMPDIIMLDNMSIDEIKEAKKTIDNKCKIEISGGINLKNIKNYRNLGVDFISIGALTHSSRCVDIGLDVI